MKRKIFPNLYMTKSLYPNYIKDSQTQQYSKWLNKEKMVKEMNRYFTKEDIQNANEHKKSCFQYH